MRLKGAVSVVTGSGSGLGSALVEGITARGGVPVVLDRAADRVERRVESLRAAGTEARGFVCDVSRAEEVGQTFSQIAAELGRIDLLINCAGRSMLVPFLEMSEDDIDWIVGPNLLGPIHCIRAAVPRMPSGSRIVNITSVSARVPTPGEALYSATKAAIASLGEGIAYELRGRGIGVTTVFPGEMSTGLFAEHASWANRTDLTRWLEVSPTRVARAVLLGVERDRSEVVCPWSMALSLLVYRAVPRLFRIGVERLYYRPLERGLAGRPDDREAG